MHAHNSIRIFAKKGQIQQKSDIEKVLWTIQLDEETEKRFYHFAVPNRMLCRGETRGYLACNYHQMSVNSEYSSSLFFLRENDNAFFDVTCLLKILHSCSVFYFLLVISRNR